MAKKKYNNYEIIKSLRDSGYKVWVNHKRPVEVSHVLLDIGEVDHYDIHDLKGAPTRFNFKPCGGRTIVAIYKDEEFYDMFLGQGEAVCSKRDNFNKALGTHIALRRAIDDMDPCYIPQKVKELVYS